MTNSQTPPARRSLLTRRAPMVVISFVVLVLGFVLLIKTQIMPIQIVGIVFVVVGFLAFVVYTFLWEVGFVLRLMGVRDRE
jgi:hypothetical protein